MAQVLLDFDSTGSICGVTNGVTLMNTQASELKIRFYLAAIRIRLDKATGIARPADACAGAGFFSTGLEMARDIEHSLGEATKLLSAASLIQAATKG